MNLPRYHILYRTDYGSVRSHTGTADSPYEALWHIATILVSHGEGSKLISITEVPEPVRIYRATDPSFNQAAHDATPGNQCSES